MTKRSNLVENFSFEEVQAALKSVKHGKVAGLDDIYLEFLKIGGPKTIKWLADFFSDILRSDKLLKLLEQTK